MSGSAGTGSISLTSFDTAATENFDTLAATGTSNTLPAGWFFDETGTSGSANGSYTAGTGSSTAGDVYSFGAAGSGDRAFGALRSGTLAPTIGAHFTNDTGASITSLAFAYTGEEWRLGTTGRADRLDFQISFDATSLTTGTWTDIDQLDFATPDQTGTAGARDGNALSTDLSYTYDLTGAIASGATFWIRWVDLDASSSDDGLGIDDFSITAFSGVTPPAAGTLNIADASILEGNSGTQDIVFTVTRADGSAGAVSATWTATLPGGSAADAGDFAAGTAFTGTVDFADGATTAEIHLAVQGDTDFEPNESFTVALSDAQGGAALGDAAATGTITNDDTGPANPPANVFINEIHYDNGGTDAGEAIEIAGVAGTDLTGYSLVLYNGSNTPDAAPTYGTVALSGMIDDEGQGYGALVFNFAANGVQNGLADGFALIAPDGSVVQFLSYEGTFTAAPGTPAAGMTSTDIGVSEDGSGAIGDSLQLTGFGATGADFTWQTDAPSSFGSLNTGQSIIPDNGTGLISVGDTSVVEGDAGTSNLVFTVHRAGGLGASATVDYTVNLDGTATLDDLGAGATLSGTLTFAAGARTATVTVPVQGDTVGEPNETLSLTLSNPTGDVSIVDNAATGTITNDDPVALSIGTIQGAGHQSAYVGQPVTTTGIVTAVDTNGFYLQDATGDGNSATSDAIFVFTSTAPTVAVGNGVSVTGTVSEFAGDAAGLTVTELTAPTVTVTSMVNDLPDALLIGVDGILPPTQVIDDDSFATFDPQNDGIDFWESLEGMRVTIETPQAVSLTNSFGETDVVASFGEGATGINDRGGITISPNGDGTIDYNPEKIQIDDDSGIFSGFIPNYSVGDQLSNVTGIVNYSFDNYEVIATEAVTVTKDVTLTQEVTTLGGDASHLSIATYNLENLDPSDNKYDILAGNIVYNLNAPDIIAVQEIQDADGAGSGSDLSGVSNAQGLIDQIFAQSGKHYAYVEIAPTTPNSTGGEPNGNIRNGFLYNIDRVDYVEGSAELIPGAAYNGTRSPLVAQFEFGGQTVTAIDVHFTSRGGSDPLWGDTQPPNDAGDAQRTAQAAGVQAYIQEHLADDPSLNIAVLGDFNGFYFEDAQTQLTDPTQGGVLTNLNTLLTPEERYSYLFGGNAQQIDNILVTGGLVSGAQYDSVHLNSQFGGSRPTDHDPQLAVLQIGAAPDVNDAPTLTAMSVDPTYIEDGSAVTLFSSVAASTVEAGQLFTSLTLTVTNVESGHDTLALGGATLVLTDGATASGGGATSTVSLDGSTATVTLTFGAGVDAATLQSLLEGARYRYDGDTPSPLDRVVTITSLMDDGGTANGGDDTASLSVTSTVHVTPVDDAPAAVADSYTVNADTAASLAVLANDTDPDGGTKSVVRVNGVTLTAGQFVELASGARVTLEANGTLTYDANHAFDYLVSASTAAATGALDASANDSFSYTLNGGSTATVNVTVAGVDGAGDELRGGPGNDTITGDAANNILIGYGGNDILSGGRGSDTMTGGNGNDIYVVDNRGDSVVDAADGGYDTVRSSITYTLGDEVERLELTGVRAINGFGNALANVLIGNDMANLLDGGAGDDDLRGGAGNDTYVVDSAGDGIFEANGQGTDTVRTVLTSYTLGANLENLIYDGTDAFTGTGNNFANEITGRRGADTLSGGGGADTLNGGTGDDTLSGDGGADTLIGGTGNDTYIIDAADTIVEAANGGIDRVRGALSINLSLAKYANVENASLTGDGAYSLTGSDGANALVGNTGANTIRGGLGADVLTGADGGDTFRYDGTAESGIGTKAADLIRDFIEAANPNAGADRDLIDVSRIDAQTHGNGNNAFTFIGSGAFHETGAGAVEGEIRTFLNASGNTVVEFNTDNSHAGAEMQIILLGDHLLANADFIL